MPVKVSSTFHEGTLVDQDTGFAVPFREQVAVVFERAWLKTKVSKLNAPFYFQNLSIGVIMGVLFFGLGAREADIFSRVSFAFNAIMGALYLPIMEVLFVFLEDSLTLRKDLLCKAHHPLAYYIAKIAAVTPVLVILLVLIAVSQYTLGLFR